MNVYVGDLSTYTVVFFVAEATTEYLHSSELWYLGMGGTMTESLCREFLHYGRLKMFRICNKRQKACIFIF